MGEIVQKDFFIELDRRDQQQIVMAAMGEVVDELFYEVKGRKALSWAGINTVAYLIGDIEINDPKDTQWERVEMFGDRVYWSATVRARNDRFGLSSLGTAEAPELMEVYDRDEKNQKIPDPDRPGEFKAHLEPDEFCRRKALRKAERNAKRGVMPTAVLGKWLQYFIQLKLFRKGTRRERPEMPFEPKTVDAEYRVLDMGKTEAPPPEAPKHPPSRPKTPTDVEQERRAKELAQRDLEERRGRAPEPKPAEGSEPSEGLPGSVEEIEERLGRHILGLVEWIVVSEHEDHYRVGKRKFLEEEMEYTVDELVRRMGGMWDKDANCWKIPKEEG